VGQAAQETALFKRGDQPVDPGLRGEIERLFHFIERGRNPALLDALMDVHEQFVLLAREHGSGPKDLAEQTDNVADVL